MIWLSLAFAAPQWESIETRFAVVHGFEDEERSTMATAERAARVVDDLVLRIGDEVGFVPRSKVHIAFVDPGDSLEAYTLPRQGTITISVHPGDDLDRTRGTVDPVFDILAHELGHWVGLRWSGPLSIGVASWGMEVGGTIELPRAAAGAELPVSTNEPYWWKEGTAEWWAEQAGANSWTTGRATIVDLAALEGTLLDWNQIQVPLDLHGFADGELVYQQGFAFVRWLERRYPGCVRAIGNESRKALRWDWNVAIRKVTGVPARELYDAFLEDALTHAKSRREKVLADGVVEGRELMLWTPEWADGKRASTWEARSHDEKVERRERTGRWELNPSSNGEWMAVGKRGFVEVFRMPPEVIPALAGTERVPSQSDRYREERYDFADWIPARALQAAALHPSEARMVVPAPETAWQEGPVARRTDDNVLWHVNFTPDEEGMPSERKLRRSVVPLGGTERGQDPALAPDGDRLAWVKHRDGTGTLMIGSLEHALAGEPQWHAISDFGPGSWVGKPAFSPDGSRLVVTVHRHHQQNLWELEIASGAWQMLTADGVSELDPVYGLGGVVFAADPKGVFNLYLLRDGEVRQLTNVVGAAYTPSMTPGGDLLYTQLTAFGFKAYGIPAYELASWTATEQFVVEPSRAAVAAEFQRIPLRRVTSHRYRPLSSMRTPALAPMLRFAGDPATLDPSVGGWLGLSDALGWTDFSFYGFTGSDSVAFAELTLKRFRPEFSLFGEVSSARSLVDLGSGREPFRRGLLYGGGDVEVPWTEEAAFFVAGHGFSLRRGEQTQFLRGERLLAGFRVRPKSRRVDWSGWRGSLSATLAHSILGDTYVDDGVVVGDSTWARAEGSLRGAAPVGDTEHRFEISLHGGATSAPVQSEEELSVGGWSPGVERPTTVERTLSFPGLAPYALSGETMGVAGFRYEIPLATPERGGTGFAPQRLSLAFGGDAASVGPVLTAPAPHSLAADVVGEVRLSARFMGDRWNSFGGFAWGFAEPDGSASPRGPVGVGLGPSGGPRFALGLGTGW